ncbi:MAG: hypothetical protein FWB97_05165 [Oscillospiraceae bacterium]|nr:hypothetical protein [Oscillospiraceae bacterium]
MKSLVPALNAQFGVGAGGKRSQPVVLAFSGRSPMAWGIRPCLRGDLFLCGTVPDENRS